MRTAIVAGVLAALFFGPGIMRAMAQWSPYGGSYYGYPGFHYGFVPTANHPAMLGSFGAVGGYHFRGIYGSYAPSLYGVYPYYERTSLGGYPGGFYYGGFPRLYGVGPYGAGGWGYYPW
jgi:hypothetical protein